MNLREKCSQAANYSINTGKKMQINNSFSLFLSLSPPNAKTATKVASLFLK